MEKTPHSTRRRSEEHTSELQSPCNLVCRLLLEKKKTAQDQNNLYCLRRPLLLDVHRSSRTIRSPSSAKNKTNPGYSLNSLQTIFFFFNDTATTEIYTLSLHDALPI